MSESAKEIIVDVPASIEGASTVLCSVEQPDLSSFGTGTGETSANQRDARFDTFPAEFPKYTTQLLNSANRFSQATTPEVVGDMNELMAEFHRRHTDPSFDDWVRFYFDDQAGGRRIEEATERLFPMVERMKRAFRSVDKEMAREFVKDLVLLKTFEGFKIQDAILAEVGAQLDVETRTGTSEEESEGVDGIVGGQPVQIKPESYDDKLQDNITVPIIYYRKSSPTEAVADISELLALDSFDHATGGKR